MLKWLLSRTKKEIIEMLSVSIRAKEGNICELITLEEIPKLTKKQIYYKLINWVL